MMCLTSFTAKKASPLCITLLHIKICKMERLGRSGKTACAIYRFWMDFWDACPDGWRLKRRGLNVRLLSSLIFTLYFLVFLVLRLTAYGVLFLYSGRQTVYSLNKNDNKSKRLVTVSTSFFLSLSFPPELRYSFLVSQLSFIVFFSFSPPY